MTKLKFQITMSVDGYVAGPRQSIEHPLGEGGEKLHDWVLATRGGRAMLGMEGGTTGPDHDIFQETFQNVGATVMGRNMFGGKGPWGENPWRGWWGENPPYHTHVFVITHHARPPLEMEGGTTFHFVTDGIQRALDRARKAAGRKDVMLGGGAEIAQQFLKAGVVDEMEIHVVPVLLGGGSRLFENTDARHTEYELVRVVNSTTVSHFKYRLKQS